MALSRAGVAATATTGIVATGGGVLWWRVAGGGEAPGMAQYAAVTIGASLLGGFVLWHRPANRYGRIHLAVGLLFGSVVLAAGALSAPDGLPAWAAQLALAWSWLALALLLPLWVGVIAAFPDGHFHRRFLGPAALALGVVMTLVAAAAYLTFPAGEALALIRVEPPPDLSGPLAGPGTDGFHRAVSFTGAALGTSAPLLAVVTLADRYRRSTLVVRQQIKWVFAGATVSVLLQAVPVGAIESAPVRSLVGVLVVLAAPLPLLAAAVAIFKRGLWEIDVVISHGLAYAVMSGVLTSAFVAAAVAAGVTVGGTSDPVIAAVVLALLVSYLAHPVRQRLVSALGRAFFGEGPRGLRALSGQPSESGDTDAGSQGARIVDVTRSALGAPWVRVWMLLPGDGAGGVLRPLPGPHADTTPPVVLPEGALAALAEVPGARRRRDLGPEVADLLAPVPDDGGGLVAPLAVDGELLGVLICGDRPGDPYDDDELALLAVLARDAALVLRNRHLADELRLRLADIEAQAEELRRSRQRLVNAQDHERRRIERNLHDGVQQQLVVLAAALRRAAGTGGAAEPTELVRLADQADEAVFTLQELARGIYPSVLVDQGLQSALQSHAARLPAGVVIEVGPDLHGRRLPQDVEAVLYFVGLEAMTNAVKHAPGARITVSLRADRKARVAVLEVHDDGPGIDPASPPGSGLQNMADRLAAAGGTFSMESVPGAGTWVRAEVPVPATVTELRGAAGSPSGRSAPQPPAG